LFKLQAQPSIGQKLGKWDNQIFIQDVNGRPMMAKYLGVDGIPYLVKDFKFGSIELRDGRKFINVPFRLNLVSQEIIFLSPNKEEGVLGGDLITEVAFADTTEAGIYTYILRTGFPEIDNFKSNQFYQIIADGKIALLKSVAKEIDTRKNDLSGEIVKEFSLREEFFIFQNGLMHRFKRDKNEVLALFVIHRDKLEAFIKANKGSFKNEQFLASIFNYYNSL
jgi:hypothetical protein